MPWGRSNAGRRIPTTSGPSRASGAPLPSPNSTDEARALGNRAIELAEALDDDHLLADTLQASLWPGLRPGDAPAKLERAIRLSALALRTGDLGQLGPAAYYRGAISYLRGDPESLDAAYGDLVRTDPGHRTGLLRLHGRLHGLRAAVHRGRVRRCRAHLRKPAGDG